MNDCFDVMYTSYEIIFQRLFTLASVIYSSIMVRRLRCANNLYFQTIITALPSSWSVHYKSENLIFVTGAFSYEASQQNFCFEPMRSSMFKLLQLR
jgi:hypothetical protein